jgi:hypothetical protein
MANVIDEFLISLGFRVDPKGGQELKQQVTAAKNQLFSLGTAVKAFATGYIVKGIASIGSTFESNTTAIAAMLATLGKSEDFNAGLKDAEKTIAKITADAAKLPGTAEDYIEVFRAGLPNLIDAMPGASADEIAAFTNRMTAIGTSILQVDPAQLGRDLQLMLGKIGGAGNQVLTFKRLIGYLNKLPGQANLTAESFNRLSQPQRLKLLQDVLFNPNLTAGLKRAESSFDAMAGAAKSMVATLGRKATAPLFEGMKKALDALSKLFIKDDGELTDLGKGFVDAVGTITGYIVRIGEAIGGLIKRILSSPPAMKALKVALIALGVIMAPVATAVGLVLLAFEDLWTYLNGGNSAIGLLEKRFPSAFRIAKGAIGFVIDAIKALLPHLPTLIELVKVGCSDLLLMAEATEKVASEFLAVVDAIERAIKATQEFLGLNTNETDAFTKIANQKYDRNGVDESGGPESWLQRPTPNSGPAVSALDRSATSGGARLSSAPHVPAAVERAGAVTTVTNHNSVKADIKIESNDKEAVAGAVERRIQRSLRPGYSY